MNMNFFKNKFFLTFKNPSIEKQFRSEILEKYLKMSNIWICFFLFFLSLGDLICENIYLPISIEKNIRITNITIITSFFATCILFIECIILCISNNYFVNSTICYINYIILIFPFCNLRENLIELNFIDRNIYSVLRAGEWAFRVLMILNVLITYPVGFFINIVLLVTACIYSAVLGGILAIIPYCVLVPMLFYFSYFNTKLLKTNFYYSYVTKEKNKWLNNLFDYMDSGFISITNNKVSQINKNLIKILEQNKSFREYIEKEERGIKDLDFLSHILSKERNQETLIDEKKLISSKYSDLVLQTLLDDMYEDYEKKDKILLLCKESFDIKNIKKLFLRKHKSDTFTFLGYKYLETEYINKDEENLNTNKVIKETLCLEVYFRYHYTYHNPEEEQLEIIFKDITKIKNIEKYKSLFLSKIAHEFKNPLICIGELAEQMNENNQNLSVFNNKHLKQIKSISDYLLMLTFDLNDFSNLNFKEQINLEMKEINLSEILTFCESIANILLMKFNKHEVVFTTLNKLSFNPLIQMEALKLKQVLVNLISNSVKCTNLGEISLNVFQHENNLVFELTDTGIGMAKDKILMLMEPEPFRTCTTGENYGSGLGIYILTNTLKKYDSILSIQSEVNKGSTFSFSLKMESPRLINQYNKSPFSRNVKESENSFITKKHSNIDYIDSQIILPFLPNREHEELIIARRHHTFNNLLNVIQQSGQLSIIPMDRNLSLSVSYLIVVDDELFTRQSAVRQLKKAALKFRVDVVILEAEDGLECLNLVYNYVRRGFKIKGIISDENMKFLNGTFVAEILKKNVKNLNTDKIKFYLLTAYRNINDRNIDKLLYKPLQTNDSEEILLSLMDVQRRQ